MSLNKVMLIGNAGKDAEVRYLDNQEHTMVASFSLATTERYKSTTGEVKENTEWHNIVAFRKSAEVCEKFVKKGTQLYIEGHLRTRAYEQNGQKRYSTEIVVDSLQLLGKRENEVANDSYIAGAQQLEKHNQQTKASTTAQPAKPAPAAPAPAQQPMFDSFDMPNDDLPF